MWLGHHWVAHGTESLVGYGQGSGSRGRTMEIFLACSEKKARAAVRRSMVLALAYSYQARLARCVIRLKFGISNTVGTYIDRFAIEKWILRHNFLSAALVTTSRKYWALCPPPASTDVIPTVPCWERSE